MVQMPKVRGSVIDQMPTVALWFRSKNLDDDKDRPVPVEG